MKTAKMMQDFNCKLLIILPKRSLTKSRQCNGKRKKKKQREDAAQKGKNKASWGPGVASPAYGGEDNKERVQ